ncbi:MAG: hypothetical protein M9962_14600 [Oligoflexia bacterium]|nr:hypothetical protein [Oligoflexia bacterium]
MFYKIILPLFFILASVGFAQETTSRNISISNNANLRFLKNNVLELVIEIPSGSALEIPQDSSPTFYNYRDSNGEVKRSTNGFYPQMLLKSVPENYQEEFTPEKIAQINNTTGGLYLSALDVNSASETGGKIPAIPTSGSPDSRYLNYFRQDGKKLRNRYSDYFSKRYGTQLNREIPMSSLPQLEQIKWTKIYQELVTIADRTQEKDRRHLFIDSGSSQQDVALARRYSQEFEDTGQSKSFGAWSIAVQGTAPRHGFGNVPCAEFASEAIRQAYTKAGYAMADDFKGDSYLIWSNTAAVVNLATALFKSGWIPWDSYEYKPMVGSVGTHAQAAYPGHAYLMAGENGRFIVDNGSPRGRDLWKTGSSSRDIIGMMYDHGVFFLPPGIIPERWNP